MKFRELFDEETMNPLWDKIEKIPEFAALKGVLQNFDYHQEDAFEHTKYVTTEMKTYLDAVHANKKGLYYLIMISAALCHDLGKATTTYYDEKDKVYKCRNHGLAGERITRKLFYDTNPIIREIICYMVRYHMNLHFVLDDEKTINDKLIFLSKGLVSIHDMLILNKCDSLGSINENQSLKDLKERWKKIEQIARDLNIYDTVYSNYKEIDRNKFTIYVMLGLPGSGKNYFIDHYKYFKENNLPVISRDDIRTEIGIPGEKPFGNKEQENKVTEICEERMIEYCKKQQSFIINNTNLRRSFRRDYIELTDEYKPQIVYIFIEPNSLEDNYNRRRGIMSLDVIDRMLDNMEFPHTSECDNLIMAVKLYNKSPLSLVPSKLKQIMHYKNEQSI